MFQRLMILFTKPKEYWEAAKTEPGDIKSLLIPQMAILAAIPAVAYFLGVLLGYMRFAFATAVLAGLFSMVLSYALNIAMWIALGFIIDGLATPFSAQRDIGQSMKLATGAVIPMWVGAALNITTIPALGWLGTLAGLGYGAYVLFLGLPIMNATPSEKAVGYAAASMGILFVVSIVVGLLLSCPMACLVTRAVVRLPY